MTMSVPPPPTSTTIDPVEQSILDTAAPIAAGAGSAAAAGKSAGLAAASGSFAAQVELMKTNMDFMIAMAWLNFALAVTSKINGR